MGLCLIAQVRWRISPESWQENIPIVILHFAMKLDRADMASRVN